MDYRGPERKLDYKTNFTRALGTIQTVNNGQKRLKKAEIPKNFSPVHREAGDLSAECSLISA